MVKVQNVVRLDVGFMAWMREKGIAGAARAYQAFVDSPTVKVVDPANQGFDESVKQVFAVLEKRGKFSSESAKTYRGRLIRAAKWYRDATRAQEPSGVISRQSSMLPPPMSIEDMTLEDAADMVRLVKDLPKDSHVRRQLLGQSAEIIARALAVEA